MDKKKGVCYNKGKLILGKTKGYFKGVVTGVFDDYVFVNNDMTKELRNFLEEKGVKLIITILLISYGKQKFN